MPDNQDCLRWAAPPDAGVRRLSSSLILTGWKPGRWCAARSHALHGFGGRGKDGLSHDGPFTSFLSG